MGNWAIGPDDHAVTSMPRKGGIGSKRYSEAGSSKPSPRDPLSPEVSSPGMNAYANAVFEDADDIEPEYSLSPREQLAPARSMPAPSMRRSGAPPPSMPATIPEPTLHSSLPSKVWDRSRSVAAGHAPTTQTLPARSRSMALSPAVFEDGDVEVDTRKAGSRSGMRKALAPPLFDEAEPILREPDWDALTRTPADQEDQMVRMVRTGDRPKAVDMQAPRDGLVRCAVLRKSGMLNLTRSYELRLEDSDTFLINGSMWHFDGYASPSYTLSLSKKPSQDDQPVQLNCNRAGTEYGLRNPGQPRVHIGMKEKATDMSVNVILRLPDVDLADRISNPARRAPSGRLPHTEALDQATLLVKRTRFPDARDVSSEELYVGRVPMPSPKNFQLVRLCDSKDEDPPIVLQFCKVSEKRYALDFAHPLTAETAFCCALAYIGRNNSHI